MSKNPETVIVTRHPALISYLVEKGIIAESCDVLSHATPEDVDGKHVIGILPLHLACLAHSVTVVNLNLPAHLRGKELTIEEIREYASEPSTYSVNIVS